MPSGPRTSPPTRLSLKPEAAPCGQVDGAWWPRSSDLPAELPALLTAVRDRLGHVERISYNLAGWPDTPRRLVMQNQMVRLGGYRTNSVHTIELRTGRGDAATLLLIPVDSSPEFAEAAMSMAARPGGDDTAEEILGNARVAVTESERK
jgi:Family of unknown function (DUF5994)